VRKFLREMFMPRVYHISARMWRRMGAPEKFGKVSLLLSRFAKEARLEREAPPQ